MMLIPTTKESDTRWKDCVEVSVVVLPILSSSSTNNTNNDHDPSVLTSSNTSYSSVNATTTATATLLLQLVGLQSSTGTVFARIRQQSGYRSSNNSPVSAAPAALPVPRSLFFRVEDILDCVLLEHQRQQQLPPAKEPEERNPENPTKSTTPTSTVLLELGSVWVFDPSTVDRPQNKPRWRRLQRPPSPYNTNTTTTTLFPVDPTMILRIHTRPARYTAVTDYFQASLLHGVGRQHSSVEVQPKKNSGSTVVTVHGQGRNNRIPQHQHGAILYEHSSSSNGSSNRFIDTAKSLGKDAHNKSGDDTNEDRDENTAEGEASFAILNKPSGLPSHATVENGTENVLYQYQHYHRTRTSSQSQEPQEYYASLPQRLDTETSGLLLIATSSIFASFISKVIENKSKVVRTNTTTNTNIHTPDIYKKYRCVVRFDSERTWKEIHTKYSHTIMEHYVDINSNAPKTFVSILPRTPPATPATPATPVVAAATGAATGAATTTTKTTMDGTTITTTEDETSEIPATVETVVAAVATATTPQRRRSCPKWQSCRLKILAMTTPLRIIPDRPFHSTSSSSTTSAASSVLPRTGSSVVVASAVASSALPFYISEFEIELLTGRTHQIRGQLAAVGCPIIGDPLYGGGSSGCLNNTTKNNNTNNDSSNYSSRRPHTVSSSTGNNHMALQCCQLSFSIDNNNIINQTKKKKNTKTKRSKKFSPLLIHQNGTTSSSSYENGGDDNNNNNIVTTRNKEAKTTTTTNSKGRTTNSSSTTYCCTDGDKPSTAILHSNNTCSSSNRSKIENNNGPQHENKNDKEYFDFHLDSAWWRDELTNLTEQQHQQRNVRS